MEAGRKYRVDPMNALFITQVYSFRDLFMSFSVNKYTCSTTRQGKKSLVVKQSGRLVETVMEVIIITYFNINTRPTVLSKSQNHHMWNKHHHKDDTFSVCLSTELLIAAYIVTLEITTVDIEHMD